jgi:hypothetical protein
MEGFMLLKTALFTISCTALSCVALSSTASALSLKAKSDNPMVKVTSFHFTGNNTQLAELCGKVSGPKSFYNLRVISDDATNNPGDYHTTSGKTGQFCIVLNTFSGTAKVEIEE